MGVARVKAQGDVTVPEEIREGCGIVPGTELLFVRTGPESFECRVLPGRRSLVGVAERYAVDGVAPDLAQLRNEMGDDVARQRDIADRDTVR